MAAFEPDRARWVSRKPVWVVFAAVVLGVLAAAVGGVTFVTHFHLYSTPSSAMSPTLVPGEGFVTSRVTPDDVRRGDLVLVSVPEWGTPGPIPKRVIGVGGDRVVCCTSGRLTINGQPVDEPYAPSANGTLPSYSVKVPTGRLFLLGDNRGNSLDSRMFLDRQQGSVPASAVSERVVWIPHDGGDFPNPLPATLKACLVLVGVGTSLVVLGLAALPIALIISARRSRSDKLTPTHGAVNGAE